MAPQLRVLAGPDLHRLTPITSLVNAGKAHHIKSDAFEGDVVVYIKDFGTESGAGETYFQSPERTGVTWSIQAQGSSCLNNPSLTAPNTCFGFSPQS